MLPFVEAGDGCPWQSTPHVVTRDSHFHVKFLEGIRQGEATRAPPGAGEPASTACTIILSPSSCDPRGLVPGLGDWQQADFAMEGVRVSSHSGDGSRSPKGASCSHCCSFHLPPEHLETSSSTRTLPQGFVPPKLKMRFFLKHFLLLEL